MVHGPAIIARSPGIVMAVRCVYAYPSGLELITVLRATGVQAEGAIRHADRHDRAHAHWSELALVIGVDDIIAHGVPRRWLRIVHDVGCCPATGTG